MKDYFFSFKYKFTSGTGELEGDRYVRDIKMKIFAENFETQENSLVGKVLFKIIYINSARNTGYDLYEIFDSHEYTYRHGSQIFDFDEQDIKEDIQKHFKYDILGSNICILERIEIIPRFRGYNLAAKATKDIIFHFSGNCALFVIQAYPLQFEAESSEQSKWQKQLELNLFPTNEKLAFKKLSEYYQSFGFEKIKGYDDLLFYNPLFANEKLNNINLEE